MEERVVHLGIPYDEADAIQDGAAKVIPSEKLAVVSSTIDGVQHDVTLIMRVLAETAEEAFERAAEIYAQSREVAGLPPGHAERVGLSRCGIPQPEVWARDGLRRREGGQAHRSAAF